MGNSINLEYQCFEHIACDEYNWLDYMSDYNNILRHGMGPKFIIKVNYG